MADGAAASEAPVAPAKLAPTEKTPVEILASGRKTTQDLNKADVEALLRINEGRVSSVRGAAKGDFEANVRALREALSKFE